MIARSWCSSRMALKSWDVWAIRYIYIYTLFSVVYSQHAVHAVFQFIFPEPITWKYQKTKLSLKCELFAKYYTAVTKF